jgi:hypothetical protein
MLPNRGLIGYSRCMIRRFAAILCVVALGLSMSGCTKCGWLWNDWGKACHADLPK